MPRSLFVAAVVTALTLAVGPARAADEKALGSDGLCHTDRAGYPREVSFLAQISSTFEYFGYFVGGACLCTSRGGDPGPLQGTYGWDYSGHPCGVKPKIVLGFCYDCRYKGGIGAYTTDKGPKVPNIPGLKLPKREEEVGPELKSAGSSAHCAGR